MWEPAGHFKGRNHPQESFAETCEFPRHGVCSPSTAFPEDSFIGSLRRLYAEQVLVTQVSKLKETGAWHAFDLKWQDQYAEKRLEGARVRVRSRTKYFNGAAHGVQTEGYPPGVFAESDLGKWSVILRAWSDM